MMLLLKCKHDRVKNPDLRNECPALRSELNVSAIVPLTHGSSDPSIKRGNLRSMGNPLYSNVDHLHEGGYLQLIPMLRTGESNYS